MDERTSLSIPILDLSWAENAKRPLLLEELRKALYEVGFLYIINHGVQKSTMTKLIDVLPSLFALPTEEKVKLSKLNNPHFLGYSGFAEETTLGKQDLREQFDLATELPVVYQGKAISDRFTVINDIREDKSGRDFTKLYWLLRGPNQWPNVPEFKEAFLEYHDALQDLSYRFVHLIEEAFDIPKGTFDHFFGNAGPQINRDCRTFLPPQHRIKLLRYPPLDHVDSRQGVGAHKDSSGWLTFLMQVGNAPGLEVLSADGQWIKAPPIDGTFVVNFGNAFEAATEGAVKATTHRVIAPGPGDNVRYSVPFFQGLPLDMTVSEVRSFIPERVRRLRKSNGDDANVSSFLDQRWDSLGESQLRKWIRSHKDVGLKWYGQDIVDYYMS